MIAWAWCVHDGFPPDGLCILMDKSEENASFAWCSALRLWIIVGCD